MSGVYFLRASRSFSAEDWARLHCQPFIPHFARIARQAPRSALVAIGKADDLAERLGDFWGAARGKTYPHAEGITFFGSVTTHQQTVEDLRFRVVKSAVPRMLEQVFIIRHISRFGAPPLLNKAI